MQTIQTTNKYNNPKYLEYNVIRRLGEGTSGIAYLLGDESGDQIVKKVYKKFPTRKGREPPKTEYLGYTNEIKILKKLDGHKHFPVLLHHDDETHEIYMSYCGERVNNQLAPKDWKKQLVSVLKTLKKLNISHNSARINNCVVKDNILHIIDFANSGKYRPHKKNITKEIVKHSATIEDVYNHKHLRATKNKTLKK